jgi:hypothetical protein
MSPMGLEVYLKGNDARREIEPSVIRRLLKELGKRSETVRMESPSSEWHVDWFHGAVFPPQAEHTPMIRCLGCARMTPIFNMGHDELGAPTDWCWDCSPDSDLYNVRTTPTDGESYQRRQQVIAELKQCGLNETEIAVLSLYYFEGHTYRSLGATVNMSFNWVAGVVRRGTAKLNKSNITLPPPRRRRGRPSTILAAPYALDHSYSDGQRYNSPDAA